MSLVFCPECAHEISTGAVACPNCGLPLRSNPTVERPVVTRPSSEGFPAWAWVPIGVVGLLILILFYFMLRGGDETSNVNVAVNARRANQSSESRTSSVPPTDRQSVTVPDSAPPAATDPGPVTTVPGTTTSQPSVPPTRGSVTVTARIMAPRGATPQPARSTRFYLLERDVESILSQAGVEPIEGNDLAGSLGLAAVYPDRFNDFQRAAMRAIANAAKYSFTTDGSGKAGVPSVEPSDYYLFGVQRVGRGFALWNSPVSVIAGENVLNLSPQMVTEVGGATG